MQFINNLCKYSREGYIELTTSLTEDAESLPIISRTYKHTLMHFVITFEISNIGCAKLLCGIPNIRPSLRRFLCTPREYMRAVKCSDLVTCFKQHNMQLRIGNCYINSKICEVIIVQLDTILLVHPFTLVEGSIIVYRIGDVHYKCTSVPTQFVEYNDYTNFMFC